MATPHTVTSPNMSAPNPFATDSDTLDFLSFMGGLDTNTAGPSPTSPFNLGFDNEAGPSRTNPWVQTGSDDARGGSTRGRTKARSHRGKGDRSVSSGQGGDLMEIDTSVASGQMQPFGPSQLLGMMGVNGRGSVDLGMGGQEFDAAQANLLQQQLEHIHMQSPLTFDANNSQSPYHPMAQMFLTSPIVDMPTLPQNGTMQNQFETSEEDKEQFRRRFMAMNNFGMITPAASGEMFPQSRTDHMSPMQLEMLARAETDPNMTPLLSPALSQQQSTSNYASPSTQTAFSAQQSAQMTKSPLEQLQEQQRQFQEQLAILQQKQNELQATAAAVAAASSNASPYMPTSRPNTSTGINGFAANGSFTNSSPGHFSPLTSPALDAHRSGHYMQQQYNRPPHPLSALSSPALNPVGSSGGAQQTLSPALQPQNNADMVDPDYINALVGLLDSQSNNNSPHIHQSPMMQGHPMSSPMAGPISGAGPHRQALPAKSRPSPMMKPTHHRSHHKHASTNGMPTSPAIQRVAQMSIPGMGYLPPAAIQPPSGPSSQHSHSGLSNSNSSTPSPVDLAHIMPPPPVPNAVPKGMTPMTPASLMNLARGDPQVPSMAPPPSRRQVAKASTAVPPPQGKVPIKRAPTAPTASSSTTKRGLAGKAAQAPGGKRALAMRPPGVGVRAAIKGAAAAAAIPLPEGETRKTSHKAAEQKRRDSLKAGFDELRLLLPAINTEALDPESGEPIPGSSAPRLLPKSSLVPDDNPNRGVSKVALLRFSNEYIVRLHDKVDKRDEYIERLRDEVRRLRSGGQGEEVRGEEGEDLLEMDMLIGEEEDLESGDEGDEDMADDDEELGNDEDEGMLDDEDGADTDVPYRPSSRRKSVSSVSLKKSPATLKPKRPSIGQRNSTSGTLKGRKISD